MRIWITALVIALTLPLAAQTKTGIAAQLNLKQGIAIEGYDPVAYFSQKALKGDKKFSATHQGATYYFSSEENRKAFVQNPSKY